MARLPAPARPPEGSPTEEGVPDGLAAVMDLRRKDEPMGVFIDQRDPGDLTPRINLQAKGCWFCRDRLLSDDGKGGVAEHRRLLRGEQSAGRRRVDRIAWALLVIQHEHHLLLSLAG